MAKLGPSGYSPYPVAVYEGILREAAEAMLTRDNPTIFPGPQVLYAWNEEAKEKAKLVRKMADVFGARIIPMYDYRPKYPKIDPEREINPNHPNLTIWHNNIKACIFVGVHCHYANVALKIIRAETDCFTIALCGNAGHEDAVVTLRDQHAEEIEKFIRIAEEVKRKLGK